METMIELNKVDKYYKSRFQRTFILKNVDFTVNEGEFVSIMGPSGAGKSTLLNIIGMLEKDKNLCHRNYIGFIFQAYHLLEDMTVYENIEMPLVYKGVKGKERKAIVADILDRFNIVAKQDLFPEQLSGGQQQLVGIARAIVAKPKLLLADEPTGNLHSEQGRQIMELLKKLNEEEGMTIIQVTHSEQNAKYGTRIVNIMDGYLKEGMAAVEGGLRI